MKNIRISDIERYIIHVMEISNSNRPLEHTPDPQLPVYGSEILSYLYFGVPGVCSRGLLKFS